MDYAGSNGFYLNFVRLPERNCPFVGENINSLMSLNEDVRMYRWSSSFNDMCMFKSKYLAVVNFCFIPQLLVSKNSNISQIGHYENTVDK